MASPLACIGLAVDSETGFQQLMSRVSSDVYESVVDGVHVGHWQDDSGAALVLGWRGSEIFDFIPTYGCSTLKWPHCSPLMWPHRE